LRRLGTVEDCAKVVEFLVIDLSDYVTGVVIPVDGSLLRSPCHCQECSGGRALPDRVITMI